MGYLNGDYFNNSLFYFIKFNMKKMKLKEKKYKNVVMIFLVLIGLFTYLLLKIFNTRISPKIYDVVLMRLNKYVSSVVMNVLDRDVFVNEELNKVLLIKENNDGEIISVDFDMVKASDIIRSGMNNISEALNDIDGYATSEGILEGNNLKFVDGNVILLFPLGMASDNVFLNQWGPRIPIGLNVVNEYYGTLDTKIQDYGLNTVLIEMYINITITNGIVINLENFNSTKSYSVLFLSKIVNGRIPDYYGNVIEKSSPLVTS